MLKVFECVGLNSFEKDGKVGRTLYYLEPFADFEKNGLGQKVGQLFTYNQDIVFPKVGERFKAFYSKSTFNGQERCVLEEILVVPFDKK